MKKAELKENELNADSTIADLMEVLKHIQQPIMSKDYIIARIKSLDDRVNILVKLIYKFKNINEINENLSELSQTTKSNTTILSSHIIPSIVNINDTFNEIKIKLKDLTVQQQKIIEILEEVKTIKETLKENLLDKTLIEDFIKLQKGDIRKTAAKDFKDFPVSPIFFNHLDIFNISNKTRIKTLKANNIVYIGDLVQKTESDLARLPHFGPLTLQKIKKELLKLNLKLGMKINGWPFPNIEKFHSISHKYSMKRILTEHRKRLKDSNRNLEMKGK